MRSCHHFSKLIQLRNIYSYSHKDEEIRERILVHLAPLKHQGKIVEWHDRKIEPGDSWATEISSQLDAADLILLLVSADFLASEYCFGVEVERAMSRLKRGEVKVIPILLKPCLWEESRFSELQILPRDAKPISSWASLDDALKNIATEIKSVVSDAPPSSSKLATEITNLLHFDTSINLVREQIRAYANLYERIRQHMRASDERTNRMQKIFDRMYSLSTIAYPLLDELKNSPLPGERLAAVAILQTFATEEHLSFLANLVKTEKPFVGYQASRALHFAVGSLEPRVYPLLLDTLISTQAWLTSRGISANSDRQSVLSAAKEEIQRAISIFSVTK
ncbi:MAG: toll/interleukin-1 receptor domain-containing protein [Anaerolineae bacterium]|nr:toll/interleukin-1 receptor domain-containing protein [Anaerolineae bacterium]